MNLDHLCLFTSAEGFQSAESFEHSLDDDVSGNGLHFDLVCGHIPSADAAVVRLQAHDGDVRQKLTVILQTSETISLQNAKHLYF